MYYIEPCCVICQRRTRPGVFLCKKCRPDYPKPWPDWLKALVRSARRELKCALDSKELAFSDCSSAEAKAYGSLNRDFNPYQNGDE